MATDELISPNLRRAAREYLVSWTLAQIGDLFTDNGFEAASDFTPPTSGERRSYVEQFYKNVDWADRDQCRRMLHVYEAVLDEAEQREVTDIYAANAEWTKKFKKILARDGFEVDDTGKLRPQWESLTSAPVSALPAESAIPTLLRRMWVNVDAEPDAAIGAAKEAIEATAKHVLLAVGEEVGKAEKMPNLIARAQTALAVHASSVAPTKDGADTIKKILASLSQAALGVNDLRSAYGTGHGRPNRSSGLTSRHAHLAVQCSDAWVRFMLETLTLRQSQAATGTSGELS